MPLIRSHFEHNRRAYRAVFSDDRTEAVLKLDFPKPFKATDHFTIFWNGIIEHKQLTDFMHGVWDSSELVAALFFFAHAELHLPPRQVNTIPSPLEDYVIVEYGVPEFARYEIYPRSVASGDNLNLSRVVGWATLPTSRDGEIGVFTVLDELNDQKVRRRFLGLLESSVPGLRDAEDGLEKMLNLMREQIQ